jgi:putative colanic acid biosynthesis acetyltransferase WcaF
VNVHTITLSNKIFRFVWRLTWLLLAAWSPVFMHRWRILILKLFGGKVCYSSYVYPNVKIWNPKNIIMGRKSCLGPNVECYNVAMIQIGDYATISQRTYLCSASHDYDQLNVTDNFINLLVGPIVIEDYVWIAAEAFIGPNKIIRNGSVILARSVVTKNTEIMGVYGGNPMKYIRDRKSILGNSSE